METVVTIEVTCPACGDMFQTIFDASEEAARIAELEAENARLREKYETLYQAAMPLPELAQEPPTMPLTHGVYIGGRSHWTVAALVALLQDGIARMTPGDLERLITLGQLAETERAERGR